MNDAYATPTNIPEEPATVSAAPSAEAPGTVTLGRYVLGAKHAEGGLGEVFLAVDTELKRDVALKRIKALNPNPDRCRRFLVEGEVTGRLEHPGVVPVYGLGHDAGGRPFYVMRFVRGETLLEAIQRFHAADGPARNPGERSKALRELLGQFVATCNTVAYAHSRGILHRDLKPSNIMLGPYGETLVVDWGLAKPFERGEEARSVGEETLAPSSEDSQQTQQGQAVGTPQYMSPEQAAGRWDAVGPASDVYSLGATLYHLLAGQVPFDGRGVGEVLDKVKRGVFPPPRERKPAVPRPLDAVCLKAMALAPEKRYQSALDLAAEVKNWLADEPVGAWREPWRMRARRWLRRHPGWVTGGVAAVLLAAVIAVTVGLVLASRERERLANDRARENFKLTLDTSDELVSLAKTLKPLPGTRLASLKRLLDLADKNYSQMLAQAKGDPVLLERTGRMLNAMSDLYIQLDTTKSLESGQQAHDIFQELLKQDANNATWQRGLAISLERIGLTVRERGNPVETLERFGQALAVRKKFAEAAPDNIELQIELAKNHNMTGQVLNSQGDWSGALKKYEEGLRIAQALNSKAQASPQARNRLAVSLRHIGDILAERPPANLAGAFDHYEKSVALCRQMTREDPNNSEWYDNLVGALYSEGWVYQQKSDVASARKCFDEVLAISTRFADLDPDSGFWRGKVREAEKLLGNLLNTDLVTATQKLLAIDREYLAFAEERTKKDPHNVSWQLNLAQRKGQVARELSSLVIQQAGRPQDVDEAITHVNGAFAIIEDLRQRFPANKQCTSMFNELCKAKFMVLKAQGKADEAQGFFVKGDEALIEFFKNQAKLEPDNLCWKENLADRYGHLAISLYGAGNLAEAEAADREYVRLYQGLADLQPDERRWRYCLAEALHWLVSVVGEQRPKWKEAQDLLKQSLDIRTALAEQEPKNVELRRDLAHGYLELSRQGNPDARAQAIQKYFDWLLQYVNLAPEAARQEMYGFVFVKRAETSSAGLYKARAADHSTASPRSLIPGSDLEYRGVGRLRYAVELVGQCLKLAGNLEVQAPEGAREARRALGLARRMLRELRDDKKLHEVQARQLEFIEERLLSLPRDAGSQLTLPEAQTALDELDYPKVAQLLIGSKLEGELLDLLDREARIFWLTDRLLEIANEPKLVQGLTAVALKRIQTDAKAISNEGRSLLAVLARCTGDTQTAAVLNPNVQVDQVAQVASKLAMLSATFFNRGRFAEASKLAGQYLNLVTDNEDRRKLAEEQLKDCMKYLELDRKLAAYLAAGAMPQGIDERLTLADLCWRYKSYHATAVRIFAEVFAAQPTFADDLAKGLRYSAACSASLAAAGKGHDPQKLDSADFLKLRANALTWLRADLQILAKNARASEPRTVLMAIATLSLWRKDTDFASVREKQALALLPAGERNAWQKLWTDVQDLREQAEGRFRETLKLNGTLSTKKDVRIHEIKMTAGAGYIIDLESTAFDTFLKVELAPGRVVASNDDIDLDNLDLNSRILFTPSVSGNFRIAVSAADDSGMGAYALRVRELVRP